MKLYKGMKKRQFKKNVGSYYFDKLTALSKYKPGDIYHDCDGFNHVVAELDVYAIRTTGGGWYIQEIQLIDEKGRYSCSCGVVYGVVTAEEINQYWITAAEDAEYIERMEDGGWDVEETLRYGELAKRGELVDSRGVLIVS